MVTNTTSKLYFDIGLRKVWKLYREKFFTCDVDNVSLTLMVLPWTVIDKIESGISDSLSGTVPITNDKVTLKTKVQYVWFFPSIEFKFSCCK